MVNVHDKPVTDRRAIAQATIHLNADVIAALRAGEVPKGDALAVARVAGIMAAKQTASLIPLCHPLPLSEVTLQIDFVEEGLRLESSVRCTGKTGVEMEALTAVSVAALTIYDMVKALQQDAVITGISLVAKAGGKRDFGVLAP